MPEEIKQHGFIQIGDSSEAMHVQVHDTIYSISYPDSLNTIELDLDGNKTIDVIFRCKGGKSDYSWGHGAYVQVYGKCNILTEMCPRSNLSIDQIGSPLDTTYLLNSATFADSTRNLIEGYTLAYKHSVGVNIDCIKNDSIFHLGFIINESTKKYAWIKASLNVSENGSEFILHSYAIRS